MIVKTEAIVLSNMKYRDTSSILRLYTREFGKISVIAKGARGTASRMRASLEPMTCVSAVIYKKENRDLQLLSQCDVLQSFRHLSEDMEKMYVAMSMIELVDIVTHDEEQNAAMYELLVQMLRTVNDATKKAQIALYYFELKLCEILGFKPDLHHCCQCHRAVDPGEGKEDGVVMGTAGILCTGCSGHSSRGRISAGSLRVMQRLQEAASLDSVANLVLTTAIDEEIRRLLRTHLQEHVAGFRRLRSEEVFATIL